MRRAAALALLCACTTASPPVPGPTPSPSPAPAGPADLTVVGSGPGYLDGMRLAAEEESLTLGTAPTLDDALDEPSPAVLMVGDAEALVRARLDVEVSGKAILLLAADLYSSRRLYRSVFQVSTPMLWEARVLAKYLVTDQGIRTARPVYGDQRATERRALTQAGREEGLRLRPDADAVISVAATIRTAGEPLAAGVGGLDLEDAPPGTVAVAPYTWAGWAEPLPRVGAFRDRFRARFGRLPGAPEQEGYDAVRLVAEALDRAGGRNLVRALESFRDEAYAGLPIRLGPDDHVLIDDSQLGLFTVPVPGDPGDPWPTDPPHWRPLMRTFTYDGQRTVILDRDKRVFFPRWRDPQPSPKYPRSRHGITEGPGG